MTDPTRLNEYNLSEKPAFDLRERMGYTYIPGANLQGQRASLRDAVLLNQLEAARLHEVKQGLMQQLLSSEMWV